jgi:hypothetical protein
MDGINTSRAISLALACLMLISQTSFSQQKKQAEQGYLNSSAYQKILKGYNRIEKIHDDSWFFMQIGEEGFLTDPSYNQYAVYIYAPTEADSFCIYVVKSRNNISTASYKRFKTDHFMYYSQKEENDFSQKSIELRMRFLETSTSKAFKLKVSEIINADHSKRQIPAYDGPIKAFFYFNGMNYHFFSDMEIGSTDMEKIRVQFQEMIGK